MPSVSYLPTLRVNDAEVPLSKFTFSAPSGDAMGVRATATIADVSVDVARGDSFDLTLRITGGSQPKSRLIKNGKVAASERGWGATRAQGLTVRSDSYSITGVDKTADRLAYAPRVPVILYDPAVVTLQDNELNTNINDEDGNRIFATARALTSLDLQQVLYFVYVEKLGFSEVITNVPNYSIPRADFSLNTTWDAIARSFYSLFEPLVFEDDDRLFIIDVYGEIPAGILSGARSVTVSDVTQVTRQNPEISVANAVLLSHKEISIQSLDEDEFPENVTQRVDPPDIEDIGTPGTEGWTQTQFRRFVAEIHDDADDPGKITSEIVWRTEKRVIGLDENGIQRELMIETQTDFYSNSWRLKLGYTKVTQIYGEDGLGGKSLQQAETEQNSLVWEPSIQNPGEYEKKSSLTYLTGLVVVEGEGADAVKTPYREATRNQGIPQDGSATIENLPISTTHETWRYTGADQIEVHTNKMDLLTKRPESSKTTEHVGTNAVRVRTGAAFNTKQVLLTDPDSDLEDGPRAAISVDAGYVQYPIAKELAFRALRKVRRPRKTVSFTLAQFDGGIRRGSVRNIFDRDGNSIQVIVTGHSVDGLPVVHKVEAVVI